MMGFIQSTRILAVILLCNLLSTDAVLCKEGTKKNVQHFLRINLGWSVTLTKPECQKYDWRTLHLAGITTYTIWTLDIYLHLDEPVLDVIPLFLQLAYHCWVALHSPSRNYYGYRTVFVISHQGVIEMPVFIHLLTKLCVKTCHFHISTLSQVLLFTAAASSLEMNCRGTRFMSGIGLTFLCGDFWFLLGLAIWTNVMM